MGRLTPDDTERDAHPWRESHTQSLSQHRSRTHRLDHVAGLRTDCCRPNWRARAGDRYDRTEPLRRLSYRLPPALNRKQPTPLRQLISEIAKTKKMPRLRGVRGNHRLADCLLNLADNVDGSD